MPVIVWPIFSSGWPESVRIRSLILALLAGFAGMVGCAQRVASEPPRPSPKVSPTVLASSPSSLYTLRNVSVLKGGRTNIVIDGSRILAIGGESRGEELEAAGLTVIPGLIDCHVHLGFFQPSQVLAGGLTSVRDLGWDPDLAFSWKKASAGDLAWGPHTLVVGNMLTASGGYPFQAGWAPEGTAAVGTPEKVDELASRGADFIKVTLQPGAPTLSAQALEALVQRAHQRGLRVSAHVSGLPELEKALDCGVDELAHMVFDSSSIADSTITRMVKDGVVVVPTLRVNPSSPRLDNLGRFARAGGRVVFGTDMGNGGGPGIDVEELRLMCQAGLSPVEVLSSATDGAADWLGMPERGRVAEGAVADLLLVRGDPLEDWSVLGQPVMVIREGLVVKPGRR